MAEHVSSKTSIGNCICNHFELTSAGGAFAWQNSKLGMYEILNNSVGNKNVYFNKGKNQYLFWVPNEGGHWLVSNIVYTLDTKYLNYMKFVYVLHFCCVFANHLYSY